MDSLIVASQSMSSFNIAGLSGITEFAMGSALDEMTNRLAICRRTRGTLSIGSYKANPRCWLNLPAGRRYLHSHNIPTRLLRYNGQELIESLRSFYIRHHSNLVKPEYHFRRTAGRENYYGQIRKETTLLENWRPLAEVSSTDSNCDIHLVISSIFFEMLSFVVRLLLRRRIVLSFPTVSWSSVNLGSTWPLVSWPSIDLIPLSNAQQ